jgi:uncharacterized protein
MTKEDLALQLHAQLLQLFNYQKTNHLNLFTIMLKVKTYLDKSPIEGLGVFAAEDIPKNTVVWEFNAWLDRHVSPLHLSNMEMEFVYKYAFVDKQTDDWILPVDNDRFTNHSEDPNTYPIGDGRMLAKRDIKKGEEITCNYREIDKNYKEKHIE